MKVATFLTTLGLLATSSLLTTHAATENRQTDSLTIKADSLNTDSTTSAFLSQKKIIISKWQRQSKLHLTSFIALAVEGSLRGMMAQWLPDDKTKSVALYNKVCGAQLSATAMKAIISKDVNTMLRELNAQRKAFATEHPQLAVQMGLNHRVGGFTYPIVRQKVNCPLDDFLKMQALQREVDWMALGLTAEQAVPKGCGQQLLKGIDLIKIDQHASPDLNRIAPLVNRIAKQMTWYISKSVYATVDHSYDAVRKKLQ